MQIPDFVTHYSRGAPFKSITQVPEAEWAKVIAQLNETNAWGLSRFQDNEYLSRRLEVESFLREAFLKKGGKPVLRNPIYFFLGRNARFEEHKGNTGYRILLKDLPVGSISFTYGDSLIAHHEAYRSEAGEKYQNPLCKQIFSYEEIQTLYSEGQFSGGESLSIEAQLWIEPSSEIVRL